MTKKRSPVFEVKTEWGDTISCHTGWHQPLWYHRMDCNLFFQHKRPSCKMSTCRRGESTCTNSVCCLCSVFV